MGIIYKFFGIQELDDPETSNKNKLDIHLKHAKQILDSENPETIQKYIHAIRIKLKINNRRANLALRNSTELMHIGSWKGEAKHGFGILGVSNGDIWFSGRNGDNWKTLCRAENVKGKWQTKVMSDKIEELIFDYNSAMEKDKIYYLSDNETKICMYDIKTGETQNIYEKTDRKIKILAAIGDNILISEWNEDDKHVNYSSAVDDKAVRQYYINNSGKVLYELD